MRQCLGRTRNFRRCGRLGDWKLFCDDHRLQPIIWVIFLVCTVAGGVASIQSAWIPHRPGLNIFLTCALRPLPVSADQPVNLLDPGLRAAGLAEWFVGTTRGWPPRASENALGKLVYRCEVINFGSAPVFNVAMRFKVILKQAYWGFYSHPADVVTSRGVSCVDAISTTDQPVIIPAIEGNAGKFVFYFYNSSTRCASLVPLEPATLEQPEKSERMRVRLKLTKTPDMAYMSLGPMEVPK
jgi:hypothetical protein